MANECVHVMSDNKQKYINLKTHIEQYSKYHDLRYTIKIYLKSWLIHTYYNHFSALQYFCISVIKKINSSGKLLYINCDL